MITLNLFGAPGAGKSTGSSYIFSRLKMMGVNAELITEFAKDKTWEKNYEALQNQCYVFGQQSYRMSRCNNKVQVLITDSPLPLSIIYNEDEKITENLKKLVLNVFNKYNNLNYFLYRTKQYNETGRNQSEEEANALSNSILDMLNSQFISYILVSGDVYGYELIIKNICKELNIPYPEIYCVTGILSNDGKIPCVDIIKSDIIKLQHDVNLKELKSKKYKDLYRFYDIPITPVLSWYKQDKTYKDCLLKITYNCYGILEIKPTDQFINE